MKRVAPWLSALVLALSAGSLVHAQTKDPADLLPAQTLACIEVRHPAKLSQEMGQLIKGSALEDIAATMAKLRSKLPADDNNGYYGYYSFYSISELGLFVSPEVLNEFSRGQGGILALTGINKDTGPVWTGILLSGESNVPGFYMRAIIASSNSFKSAGEVEGVHVYNERRYIPETTRQGVEGVPVTKLHEEPGVAVALMPGMVIFGSSPDQVKDVIRRAKGKSSDPALSSLRAFKDAGKLRERPGFFAYADLEAFAGQMDDAAKTFNPNDKVLWEQFKILINPRAFRAALVSLSIQNSNVELVSQFKLVPGQTSPLVDMLPNGKSNSQLLQYVPRDAALTMNVGVGDGEKNWAKFVELLDTLAKTAPNGDLPSKKIKDAQESFKIDFGKELFGRLKEMVLSMPGKNDSTPLIVMQGVDAAATKHIVEVSLPKLMLVGSNTLFEPKKSEVDGVTLYSGPMQILMAPGDCYYGSHGDVVVLGFDAKMVAAALKNGAKKEGLLSQPKVAAALKETDGVTVGVVSVGTLTEMFHRSLETSNVTRYNDFPPPRKGDEQPPVPPAPKLSERAQKSLKEVATIVEPLPPLIVSVTRKEDVLTLEARQPGLKIISVKLIDFWVEAAFQRVMERAEEEKKRREEDRKPRDFNKGDLEKPNIKKE